MPKYVIFPDILKGRTTGKLSLPGYITTVCFSRCEMTILDNATYYFKEGYVSAKCLYAAG